MSVTCTETATSQLLAIHNYLARSSPGYARVLAGRVVTRTEALADSPRFGAEVPEYGDADIRGILEHPYRILYRVNGSDVQILGAIHASR